MGAENIYDLIVEEKPQLAATLNSNESVSSFLMSVYSHLLHIAIDSRNDPKELICLVDIARDRVLRIQAIYYKEAPRISTNIAIDKTPVNRNLSLVNLLRVNRNVRDLAQRVVEILERWVAIHPATKKQGFKNIKIMEPRRQGDGTIFTAELVVHFEFEEFVNAKMKWEMDEEPQEKGLVTL